MVRLLKKLIILAVLAYVGWNYYQDKLVSPQVEPHASTQTFQPAKPITARPAANFICDGRQHCSQMRSREEAEFFLKNCPNTKMDGDRDGIPCERDSRF